VTNVHFLKGRIEQIPLPASSVDVVIEVADGMHAAIVKAVKAAEPAPMPPLSAPATSP